MDKPTPSQRLDRFIDEYPPEIAARARQILTAMQRRLPGAVRLVYDGYTTLAVGFGPSEKASEAPFSIALYPRHVVLVFIYGAGLPDPEGILRGGGKQVRNVILEGEASLDRPAIRALMNAALEQAGWTPAGDVDGPISIRAEGGPRRPRRIADRG
jgi:hypothetical protein